MPLDAASVGLRIVVRYAVGGTGLPVTMSATGISTGGPDSGRTVHTPSRHDVQTPRTSVIAGPPDGPVSPRTTRRTTTR